MRRDELVWLHAVTRDVPADRFAGAVGVGGDAVRLVTVGGLTAVVGGVPAAEFGEDPLRRNLEDLAWLEVVARAHHRVVDAVARAGPVVPMRLATVYRDDDRVGEVLADRRDDLSAVLDRLAGRAEWGVKAYAVPGAAVAAVDREVRDDRPGLAYLRRRQAQLSSAELAQQAALRAAERVHDVLGRHAAAARRHPPQDRRLTGRAGWMVLNGAYLNGADHAGDFAVLVGTLAGRHPELHLEVTGPWPPYSFAGLDMAELGR
ncbi:GvpL/GvpF family gas vesicle protein [Plantactinospora siamensis]|uniref:GvpL/GvpF family gas vesicle protein n=1 Tax=Plantactinospora siamensis TaxID=555372 RepID=A0ABV6NUC7_9ACTN